MQWRSGVPQVGQYGRCFRAKPIQVGRVGELPTCAEHCLPPGSMNLLAFSIPKSMNRLVN